MHHTFLMASIFSPIGDIFHPLFWVFAQVLAFFYSIVPNYIIAITLLTVLVMLLTAPLTVKSTKSMIEMQRIQPEFKKLQAKYKGDREKLNEEVMKLYREHGVSPVGGCLPLLLQMPFFVCLYGVIKGLTNAVTVHGHRTPQPRYLSHTSQMYHNILAAGGQIKSFGIDLSQTPFHPHGSVGSSLPYWILFFAAIGLQYMQMARLNKRNAANIQNNPQMQTMQTMQKVTPLIFGVIYIAFPVGVTVYFIVSSLCRIIIQEILFRAGITAPRPPGESGPRDVSAPRRRGVMDRLADAQANARAAAQEQARRKVDLENTIEASSSDLPKQKGPTGSPQAGQITPGGSTQPSKRPQGTANGSGRSANGNGSSPGAAANKSNGNGSASNGRPRKPGNTEGQGAEDKPKQAPPRSKDKRPRKAR
jgi:YidC/Oxa1 family membrane protein insertase